MQNRTTKITLYITVLVAVGIVVLLPFMPALLRWYGSLRNFSQAQCACILAAYVLCAAAAEWALVNMIRILRSILAGQVFVTANLRAVRCIRTACLLVSLVCLAAAFVYLPLIIVTLIMGFLSLTVGVLCQVLKAAVAIREENDLTI
ncbi:MAG: DUF2975 domain-containing protein [Firmicutes bacterium]|nr:DUF2975 domain-containing protein [Bacillota bacterium]